jgi:hypothetical protein
MAKSTNSNLDKFHGEPAELTDETSTSDFTENEIATIMKVRSLTREGAIALATNLGREAAMNPILPKQPNSPVPPQNVSKRNELIKKKDIQKRDPMNELESKNGGVPTSESGVPLVKPTDLIVLDNETPILQPVMSVQDAVQQINFLKQVISEVLIQGEDYGIPEKMKNIPDIKPFLFKPGAAKIANIFGLRPVFEFVERFEDHVKFEYRFLVKCTLIHKKSGIIHGEAYGAASSAENRFKNRGSPADNWHNVRMQAEKRAYVGAVKQSTRVFQFFSDDNGDVK